MIQVTVLFVFIGMLLMRSDAVCMHDELQSRMTVSKLNVDTREGFAAVGPIRITFILDNIQDSTKYCTASGDVRQSWLTGGPVTCRAADVFGPTQYNTAIRVLDDGRSKVQSIYSVNQLSTPIKFKGTQCSKTLKTPAAAATGYSDTDLVVFVTALPSGNFDVASGMFCTLANEDRRPILGVLNLDPQYLATHSFLELSRAVLHSLHHVMGFSRDYWKFYFPSVVLATEQRRGKTVTYIATSKAVAASQEYFGCPTLSGPEVDDTDGSFEPHSHWKGRNSYQDLMSGVLGDNRISRITLALMEDSGNYFANYSAVEDMQWGLQRGCPFIYSPCIVNGDTLESEFCNITTDTSGVQRCTFDGRAIGYCATTEFTSPLPSYEQYFSDPQLGGSVPLMDYCPTVQSYTNRQCDVAGSDVNDPTQGIYYGPGGRCVFSSIGSSSSFNRCMQLRCPSVSTVEVLLGTTWVRCPFDGAVVSGAPYGYTGDFTCPVASVVCTYELYTTSATAAPIVSPPTAAPTTTTTAVGTPPPPATPQPVPPTPIATSTTRNTPAPAASIESTGALTATEGVGVSKVQLTAPSIGSPSAGGNVSASGTAADAPLASGYVTLIVLVVVSVALFAVMIIIIVLVFLWRRGQNAVNTVNAVNSTNVSESRLSSSRRSASSKNRKSSSSKRASPTKGDSSASTSKCSRSSVGSINSTSGRSASSTKR